MRLAERVLDLARWAPSGDNTQPWRFVVVSDTEFEVHGYDTRTHCVYDLDGAASQFAHGILLETIAVSATRFGCEADITAADPAAPDHQVYRVRLLARHGLAESPLAAGVEARVVQRRAMIPRSLAADERAALEEAANPLRVVWMDTLGKRWRMAALNAFSAHIRLTIPEAFAVHKATIEWGVTTSPDKMPSASLGAPSFFLPVMQSAMKDWETVDFLNRHLGGTLLPRLLLDWVPGLFCSAHFALVARSPSKHPSDHVAAGRATQRFWLTATRLGLQVQPLYTPLVFANYAREERTFTGVEPARRRAAQVLSRLEQYFGADTAGRAVFLGRLGGSRPAPGRSIRRPLQELVVSEAPAHL